MVLFYQLFWILSRCLIVFSRHKLWSGCVYKFCSVASRSHILTADWLALVQVDQSQSRFGCTRLIAGMAEDRRGIPRMRRWQPLWWGQHSLTILCWYWSAGRRSLKSSPQLWATWQRFTPDGSVGGGQTADQSDGLLRCSELDRWLFCTLNS